MIEVYTDGSCWPNDGTGNGIFGFVVVENNTKVLHQHVSGRLQTTNNRMELCGVVSALKYILENYKDEEITIHCDSNYVVKGYNIWIHNWIAKKKENVANWDIWSYIHDLRSPKIKLQWIKGHAGHQWNELIDTLCNREFEKRYGTRARY